MFASEALIENRLHVTHRKRFTKNIRMKTIAIDSQWSCSQSVSEGFPDNSSTVVSGSVKSMPRKV